MSWLAHAQTRPKAASRTSRKVLALSVAVVLLLASGIATAYAGYITRRVNTDPWGVPGSGLCTDQHISGNGRYVIFSSNAWSLVPGDTNGVTDVFVKDRSTGAIYRVNVSSTGTQATSLGSNASDISHDGRFILYSSSAANLVTGDTNVQPDIFLYDCATFATKRVSVSSANAQADGSSARACMSPDGKFVAFRSLATNLVANDTNADWDIFVRNVDANTTNRVSVSKTDVQADDGSYYVALSNPDAAGHRIVAFHSVATNLIDGVPDTNSSNDVFVKDLTTQDVTRISVSAAGAQGDDNSENPDITPDGRFVAFESWATNLVSGDTNTFADVFLRDRLANTITRVSVSSTGAQPDADCYGAKVSSDGRFVYFTSAATNLVPGDTNGEGDVFMRDLLLQKTYRISVSDSGTEGNGYSEDCDVDASGRVVTYRATASNLVPEDYNSWTDIMTTVLPKPAVRVNPAVAPYTVYVSRGFTAYAMMAPRHSAGTYPIRIFKYRYVNGVWRSYGYVKAKAANYGGTYDNWSKCSVVMSLPYRGRWRLRAYAPADTLHAATWSASYRYVTVK